MFELGAERFSDSFSVRWFDPITQKIVCHFLVYQGMPLYRFIDEIPKNGRRNIRHVTANEIVFEDEGYPSPLYEHHPDTELDLHLQGVDDSETSLISMGR